jgi:hypothetical protein
MNARVAYFERGPMIQEEHQLRISADSRVGPKIALPWLRGVLLLRATEPPNFVRLDALALKPTQGDVLVERAEVAHFGQGAAGRRPCWCR